jgi:hypothetical protein
MLLGFFSFAKNLSAATCSGVGFSCKSMTCVNPDAEDCPSGYDLDRSNCNSENTACCCVKQSSACNGTCKTSCLSTETEDSSGWDACNTSGLGNKKCCATSSGDNEEEDENDDDDDSDSDTSVSGSGGWEEGLELIGSVSKLPSTNSEYFLEGLLLWLLRIFTILAVIAFVVAGIMYLLAGPDKNMAEKAKAATFYSIIAIVVALISYIIIRLIFDLLWGGYGQ